MQISWEYLLRLTVEILSIITSLLIVLFLRFFFFICLSPCRSMQGFFLFYLFVPRPPVAQCNDFFLLR